MRDITSVSHAAVGERGHIVVADDDVVVLQTLQRLLSRAGHSVTATTDGEKALEAISRGEPDLVITDIDMPVVGGLDLLKHIKAAFPHVAVILLTGHPEVASATSGVKHGAFRYLVKPFENESMLEDVREGIRSTWTHRLERTVLAEHAPTPDLEAQFERAFEGLWMAFQPIYFADGRGVMGYEALMRSTEPTAPHPGILIDAAERLDRLRQLGRTVRELSTAAFERYGAPGTSLFVNLHPLELHDPELYSMDAPLSRIAPRIVLEITERTSLTRVDDLLGRLTRLRRMGFRIAVDDLGAGYASLTSLSTLRPDVLKVDMGLVRDVDRDRVKRSIIGAIVHFARELNMPVVAEGVETPSERACLQELGCDLLQGYLLGRPMDPGQLLAWSNNAARPS